MEVGENCRMRSFVNSHPLIGGFIALCCVLAAFFSFVILYTVGRTPWTCDQNKYRINAHRHPIVECDSNPHPQRSGGRCAATVIGFVTYTLH
jgi:hypothetical protein